MTLVDLSFITFFQGSNARLLANASLSAGRVACAAVTSRIHIPAPRLVHAKVTHSGLEVHRSASVEQQCCYVDVPIVSGDVKRRETALKAREKERNQ